MKIKPPEYSFKFKIFFKFICLFLLIFNSAAYAAPLDDYIRKTDPDYAWKLKKTSQTEEFAFYLLDLTSQQWKGTVWRHQLLIVIPAILKNSQFCFLNITGDSSPLKSLDYASKLAISSGSIAAVLNRIPNQPLFDGKKEDRLLAYSLKQFIDSGDREWPVLFPMAKSVIRAMDGITEFLKERNIKTNKFVLSGSSKRAWTSYLTAASDPRVAGVAPIVFDMLNMKAQTDWAQKMYGAQSEKIKNYTELGLIERISEPRTTELRKWIDPFSYLDKLNMPKLILLGTNDPYWVVDAQIHYFNALQGSKLIYQVPNGTHHVSSDAELQNTLAYWFAKLTTGDPLPEVNWKTSVTADGLLKLVIRSSIKISSSVVWQADSEIRDFRNAVWHALPVKVSGLHAETVLKKPKKGYRAAVAEISIEDNSRPVKFSTTAFVLEAD